MTQQATVQLTPTLTVEYLKQLERTNRWQNLGRGWHRFSRNPLSIFGLVTVLAVILLAIFAPFVTPNPEHVKPFTDFANASRFIEDPDRCPEWLFLRLDGKPNLEKVHWSEEEGKGWVKIAGRGERRIEGRVCAPAWRRKPGSSAAARRMRRSMWGTPEGEG